MNSEENKKKYIFPVAIAFSMLLFIAFAVLSDYLVVMDISVNDIEISSDSANVKVSASGESFTVKNGAASSGRKYYEINETDDIFIRQLLAAFCWDALEKDKGLSRKYGLSYLTVDGVFKGLYFETQSLSHARKDDSDDTPAKLFDEAVNKNDTENIVDYFVFLQITRGIKNISEDYELLANKSSIPYIVPKRVEYSFNTYPGDFRYMTYHGDKRVFTPEDFGISAENCAEFLKLTKQRYQEIRKNKLSDAELMRITDRFARCITQVDYPLKSGKYNSDSDFTANDYYLDAVNSFKGYLKSYLSNLDEYYEKDGNFDSLNIAGNSDEGFSSVYTCIENKEKLYLYVKDNKGYFYLPSYVSRQQAEAGIDRALFKSELSELDGIEYITSKGNSSVFISTANNTMEFINENKDNREPGAMTVYDASGQMLYNGNLERVKGKGHSSFTHADKKNYRVIFNSPATFSSFEEASEIIMVANALDGTRLRNKVAYSFAKGLSMQVPEPMEYVDAYFNGRYWGNYLLLSPVKADASVDYMFETCVDEERNNEDHTYFTDKNNMRYELDYPVENQIVAAIETQNRLNEALAVIEDENADARMLSKYIDTDSFAKQYIMNTLFDDVDANSFSTFYCIDNEGRLCAGPVWDFDLTLGNHGAREDDRGEDSYIHGIPETLIKNVAFKERVRQIYAQYGEKLMKQALDVDFVPDSDTKASLLMDFSRWSYLARTPADMKEHAVLVQDACAFLINREKILKERLK